MTRRPRMTGTTKAVLAELLRHREIHGYAIVQKTGVFAGTVYPILDRLADAGWTQHRMEEGEPWDRPLRKYWRLTDFGRREATTVLYPPKEKPKGTQPATPELPHAIAYKIRAELVCCNVYETGDPETAGIHEICYWGEAAARLAEAASAPDTAAGYLLAMMPGPKACPSCRTMCDRCA